MWPVAGAEIWRRDDLFMRRRNVRAQGVRGNRASPRAPGHTGPRPGKTRQKTKSPALRSAMPTPTMVMVSPPSVMSVSPATSDR